MGETRVYMAWWNPLVKKHMMRLSLALCLSMSVAFEHSLTFPSIPYELGLRFIHTPENWMLLPSTKNAGRLPSLFRFVGSESCAVVGDYCTTRFHMRPLMYKDEGNNVDIAVHMLTSQEDECMFVLKNEKNALLSTVNLSVRRKGAGGHVLRMEGEIFPFADGNAALADVWNQQLQVIVSGLALFQQESIVVSLLLKLNAIGLSEVKGPLLTIFGQKREDANLTSYREIVFAARKAAKKQASI